MNPADPLQQLHPLREPTMLGWWPIAPGWWLLAALLLLGIGLGSWLLYRRYHRNAYRRLGLGQLEIITGQYQRDTDETTAITAINALLKSVALQAYPRRDIAAISGDAWLDFLRQSAPDGPVFTPGTLDAQYRKDAGAIDIASLAIASRHWISRHQVTL